MPNFIDVMDRLDEIKSIQQTNRIESNHNNKMNDDRIDMLIRLMNIIIKELHMVNTIINEDKHDT
tara:strand:- start:553 stop:747 length:195 start_codon:yes stop_codon:yes gene_type:complete